MANTENSANSTHIVTNNYVFGRLDNGDGDIFEASIDFYKGMMAHKNIKKGTVVYYNKREINNRITLYKGRVAKHEGQVSLLIELNGATPDKEGKREIQEARNPLKNNLDKLAYWELGLQTLSQRVDGINSFANSDNGFANTENSENTFQLYKVA